MTRILIAVSTPQASERLVEPIADLARRLEAEVLVVHVSRPTTGAAASREAAEGEQSVQLLADRVGARGVPVQTLLLFSDDVAQAILNTADQRQVSVIVLGLTGKNVFARLTSGNVPVELVRETKIPVMLLPPDFKGTV
jgi:nucleotide-binding universal stress UspA family protein